MQKNMSKVDKLLVAAIDFGTTYSGYAFSFKHEYEKDPIKMSANNWTAGSRALVSLKTPTVVLLKPDKTFESFGYEAEDKYAELALDEEHSEWYFFKRFKMLLFDSKTLKRNIDLPDDKGRKMPALTIFTMAIKYLKDHLLKTLDNRATGIKADDIHWVLTVPAIWNDSAKQFMREAAQKAGINGKYLTIALEPEAASLYCKHLPVDKIHGLDATKAAKGGPYEAFSPGTQYLVLDAGGGTVDITVHEVQAGGRLKELQKASGGAWGGTKVDEAFRQLLIEIVGSDIMQSFSQEHTDDYMDIFREFETKKRSIKAGLSGKITFKLPISFSELYEERTGEDIKAAVSNTHFAGKITWTGDKMRIEADVMIGLFDGAIHSIVKHVRDLFRDRRCAGTSTILMVGGFSESPLLQQAIKQQFPDKRVIVPEEAGLAVLKGAVLYAHDPSIIDSRVSKYSYGVRVYRDFEDGVDPDDKKVTIGGRVKCKDMFGLHVKKGETLKVGVAQQEQRYTPLEASQTSMVFDIYTSPNEDQRYVTDASCSCIGKMEVDLPDTGGRDRGVIAKMIFGGTEIEVEARDENTGKITTARFNFL